MGTPVSLPSPRAQVGGEGFLEETAFVWGPVQWGKPGAPGCRTPAPHTSGPFPPSAEQDGSPGFVVGWGWVTG